MKTLTPSELRSNIYKVLDHVVKTGQPTYVERNGVLLQITSPQKKSKLARLKKRPDALLVDPESIIELDWEKEWKPKF